MSTTENYEVTIYDGRHASVQNEQGGMLSLEELEQMIYRLQAVMSYMRTFKVSQERWLQYIATIRATEIAEAGEWVFEAGGYGYSKYRTDTQGSNLEALDQYKASLASGLCVYFLRHHLFPGLIKIGYTQDLYERTKSLTYEHSSIEPKVIAFIRTKDYKDLEKYLHMTFHHSRRTGEWFVAEPIEWFINVHKQRKNQQRLELELAAKQLDSDTADSKSTHVAIAPYTWQSTSSLEHKFY